LLQNNVTQFSLATNTLLLKHALPGDEPAYAGTKQPDRRKY